jgi:hypothetical protein
MRKREEIAWIEKREFKGESTPVPFDEKNGSYQFIDDLKAAYKFLSELRKNDKENLYRLVREEKEIIIGQWV